MLVSYESKVVPSVNLHKLGPDVTVYEFRLNIMRKTIENPDVLLSSGECNRVFWRVDWVVFLKGTKSSGDFDFHLLRHCAREKA